MEWLSVHKAVQIAKSCHFQNTQNTIREEDILGTGANSFTSTFF
jgi:hypothetical protein